jgi:pimeloyl-ACP methyl ester carboxylesterase
MRDFHPVVMLVHGINTHGDWQKIAQEVFADAKITARAFHKPISVPAFLRRSKRKEKIEQFLEWYTAKVDELRLDLDDPYQRPSVVAHSFGTWFVSRCMLIHPEVRFDKMILLGAIVPTDFAWHELFLRDQVQSVRNECGWGDIWAGMVRNVVPGTGPSGRYGFKQRDVHGLTDHNYEHFEHSTSFYKQHMTEWVKVVSRPPVDLRVRHGAEIEDGYVATLNLTHLIDVENFQDDPAFEQADVPRGLSTTWIAVNQDLYTFVIDHDGKPQGYINAMPLTAKAYVRVKSGLVDDNEIKDTDLLPYLAGSEIDIYLMSIAISKAVRRENDGLFSRPLQKLLNGFVYKLVRYARDHGIVVRRLLAVGWTTQGRKLCEHLGMELTGGTDKHGHPIYELDLLSSDVLKKKHLFAGLRKLVAVMQKSDAARA